MLTTGFGDAPDVGEEAGTGDAFGAVALFAPDDAVT